MVTRIIFTLFIPLFLIALGSCNKLEEDENPVTPWENTGPDSARLTVTVQTQAGILMVGSYVNLALSQDSLNKNLLVRRVMTDGVGKAVFSRLYPRKFYSNCFAYIEGKSLFGSFRITIMPYAVRDTVLIVH